MKLYTQILLGMLAGVIVGLTLGPRSQLLSADLYTFSRGDQARLYLDEAGQRPLQALSSAPLSLKLIDYKAAEAASSDGGEGRPAWAKVSLRLSKAQLVAPAQRAALADAIGRAPQSLKVGEELTLWLKLTYLPLEGGGFVVKEAPISSWGHWLMSLLAPIGAVFMRLLKMVIVPLVFSSLLVGIASLGDIRKLGRLGGRTIGLYLMTTALAVSLGLFCAHLFNPGAQLDEGAKAQLQAQFDAQASAKAENAAAAPSMVENLLEIIPTNPIASLAAGDMLQIIFFALFLGIALTMLREKGETFIRFFDDLQEAMVMTIQLIMKLAPYGVAALVAVVIGQSGWSILKALLLYGFVVCIGLTLHCVLVYGGIVRFVAKVSFREFFQRIRPAQLLAFSTSSSSATLPVSMEIAEEKLGISGPVSSFVLPLGSTVNMDGTALYQGVAAIFIAQVFGIDLSLGAQLSIVLAATMASVGAAGVPGAGIVTLAMVLTSSGIPQEGIALILGMDRLLDMFRTAVNVTGDLAVTATMASLEGEQLLPDLPAEGSEMTSQPASEVDVENVA